MHSRFAVHIALYVLGIASGLQASLLHAGDSGVLYGVRVSGQQLIVSSLDLSDGRPPREVGRLRQEPEERLAGLFQTGDRSVGMLRISTGRHAARRAVIRMVGIPERVMDISSVQLAGIASPYAVSSILIPRSGAPLALIAHYTDTPPYRLANLDLSSGAVKLLNVPLGPLRRYGHLTQCPDGNIYGISVAPEANIHLVRFDMDQGRVAALARLSLDGKWLNAEVLDLVCGPSGSLLALTDPRSSGVNSLYKLDGQSGDLRHVTEFDVERVIFVR